MPKSATVVCLSTPRTELEIRTRQGTEHYPCTTSPLAFVEIRDAGTVRNLSTFL